MVSLKYAHVESERRFLLAAVPEVAVARTLHLTDRYLKGTHLRLRTVEEGGSTVHKLGQKLRYDESEPSTNTHTTLYLDAGEHALLSGLPAWTIRKTRLLLATESHWAVDSFASGLVLAETEGSDGPPFAYVCEVTDDVRYSGAELAKVDGQRPVV